MKRNFRPWYLVKGRGLLYKLGFRPKPASIWFSPSLSYIYSTLDEEKRNGA